MLAGLSQGDDPDCVFPFGMDDRDHSALEQTEGHEPLLPIAQARIFEGHGQLIEYGFGVEEVDAMSSEVGLAFVLVPFEPHVDGVTTDRSLGNFREANRQ